MKMKPNCDVTSSYVLCDQPSVLRARTVSAEAPLTRMQIFVELMAWMVWFAPVLLLAFVIGVQWL